MAYLAILSASEGKKAGFAAIIGIALGLAIVGIAASLGVATLISNSTLAYETLRWGGVLYLLWLAFDGWRSEREIPEGKMQAFIGVAKFFKRGLITNLLNPKAVFFFVAILPTFIDLSSNTEWQSIALTAIYVSVATLIHGFIVIIAGTARDFLENPQRRQRARRILSVMLAGIAVWLAFSTNRNFH